MMVTIYYYTNVITQLHTKECETVSAPPNIANSFYSVTTCTDMETDLSFQGMRTCNINTQEAIKKRRLMEFVYKHLQVDWAIMEHLSRLSTGVHGLWKGSMVCRHAIRAVI